nr:MAG TPA: hypothetical protein [Caudoviricetes sp.]
MTVIDHSSKTFTSLMSIDEFLFRSSVLNLNHSFPAIIHTFLRIGIVLVLLINLFANSSIVRSSFLFMFTFIF